MYQAAFVDKRPPPLGKNSPNVMRSESSRIEDRGQQSPERVWGEVSVRAPPVSNCAPYHGSLHPPCPCRADLPRFVCTGAGSRRKRKERGWDRSRVPYAPTTDSFFTFVRVEATLDGMLATALSKLLVWEWRHPSHWHCPRPGSAGPLVIDQPLRLYNQFSVIWCHSVVRLRSPSPAEYC